MMKTITSILVLGLVCYYGAYASKKSCNAVIGSQNKHLLDGDFWTVKCTTMQCLDGNTFPEDAGCRDPEAGCKVLGEIWKTKDGKDVQCVYSIDKYVVEDVTEKEEDVIDELVKEADEEAEEDEKKEKKYEAETLEERMTEMEEERVEETEFTEVTDGVEEENLDEWENESLEETEKASLDD